MCKLKEKEFDEVVNDLLIRLGFNEKLTGFCYLHFSILFYIKCYFEYHEEISLTKVIYPTIAKRYGCSQDSIDRAIRFCVKQCWLYGDVELQCTIFDGCIGFKEVYPTASTFVRVISKYIINEAAKAV